MSHDDRDKRGGHAHTDKGMHSCGCCPILSDASRSTNRTKRNRALEKHERNAEQDRGEREHR